MSKTNSSIAHQYYLSSLVSFLSFVSTFDALSLEKRFICSRGSYIMNTLNIVEGTLRRERERERV